MHKLPKTIKVLVVDDSPFIRMALKKILSSSPDIEVVGFARDGKEGIRKAQELKPDVITMDVEMPVMNGIQALEEIMRWQPTPVIILSSVTTEGAKLTMKAFDLGAAEVVAKPSGKEGNDLESLSEDIILKIKSVAEIDPFRLSRRAAVFSDFELKTAVEDISPPMARRELKESQADNLPRKKVEIVAIGTSTCGPAALQTVLPQFPENFPVPVIVSQHMPVGFTAPLASRLDSICRVRVKEVEQGEELKAGVVYIGKAGQQFQVKKGNNGLVADISEEAPITTLYKPSVDVMYLSLAKEVGAGVLGVVMTGMGSDGLRGMKELKAQGAFSVAEAESTCIVYGMPRSIVEANLADRIEPLTKIGRIIIDCVDRG